MHGPKSLRELATFEFFLGLSVRYSRENLVLPLKQKDGHILLAMVHPDNQEVQAAMEVALQAPVLPIQAVAEEILESIHTYEPGSPMSRLMGDLEGEELDLEAEESSEIGQLRDMAREAPIIQLIVSYWWLGEIVAVATILLLRRLIKSPEGQVLNLFPN